MTCLANVVCSTPEGWGIISTVVIAFAAVGLLAIQSARW
jgi:hypothetical protein